MDQTSFWDLKRDMKNMNLQENHDLKGFLIPKKVCVREVST